MSHEGSQVGSSGQVGGSAVLRRPGSFSPLLRSIASLWVTVSSAALVITFLTQKSPLRTIPLAFHGAGVSDTAS